MLIIYKNTTDIPQSMPYVELNDLFFNQTTVLKLDENAKDVILKIDGAEMLSKFKIKSRFNGATLDIDCLSTGCKTVLNVLYHPHMVFCLKECGDNALEYIYGLEQGAVYSDYPLIPFTMKPVTAVCSNSQLIIDNYEDLKEWWNDEE